MKKQLLITALAICSFSSYAKEPLTKDEATKLVGIYSYTNLPDLFIEKVVNKFNIPKNITDLKNAGLIALVESAVAGHLVYEVKLTEKNKQYIIVEREKYYRVYVVKINLEVSDISKPEIDGAGNYICYIDYKEIPARTPFFAIWGGHCFDRPYTVKAKFKTDKDRWVLVDKDYYGM